MHGGTAGQTACKAGMVTHPHRLDALHQPRQLRQVLRVAALVRDRLSPDSWRIYNRLSEFAAAPAQAGAAGAARVVLGSICHQQIFAPCKMQGAGVAGGWPRLI